MQYDKVEFFLGIQDWFNIETSINVILSILIVILINRINTLKDKEHNHLNRHKNRFDKIQYTCIGLQTN